MWLAMLSLSHVTLEFPLNWISFKECAYRGASIWRLRGTIHAKEAPSPTRN
jgi:hypothetical protein